MRSLFILMLSLAGVIQLHAQNLTGYIKDSKGNPVSNATVSLLRAADSALVKIQVSKENGSYQFTEIAAGNYLLSASFVGHIAVFSPVFPVSGNDTSLSHLILAPATADLKAVAVTARKPLLEIRADKTILNIEGTINAAGNNALELLRRAPGVTVDHDEKLSMNGKNGVQVFIDGRPTPLSGTDLSNYLRSLQSAQVEAIELITNPSAKYEAAGNAGIINIRLKKNKGIGTNGAFTAGLNIAPYAKYNTGLSLNHRNEKLNVFATYNHNGGTTRKDITMHRTIADSIFDQKGRVLDNSKTHSFKTGADLFINKQSTIGIIANGNFTNTVISNTSATVISGASALARTLTADNRLQGGRKHMDFNLNYLYNETNGKNLSLNADYGFYKLTSNQLQPNLYYDHLGQFENKIVYEMIAPANIDIYSFKGDYEQPFLKGKLGFGGKFSHVQTDNDFQRYNVVDNNRHPDTERSNRFVYNENLLAGYINFNRQWEHITLQAGLRAENTAMKGSSTGKNYDSSIHRNYLNLFPSFAINYAKSKDHQFALSFSRRIDRPAYQDLNPFEYKVDDYLIQKGNSYLRPQYTNSIGLTYIYRQQFNAALNYSAVKDLFTWIVDTTETSKSLVSKKNLANQKVVSMNIGYQLRYKDLSVITNLSTGYSTFRADFGAGRTIREQAFNANLFMQASLKFAKIWTAELSGFYNSPTVQEGNMHIKAMWSMDAGLQTKLFSDKALLKLSISDVFNTLRFRSNSVFAGQTVLYNTKWETRQLKLSLAWRFGRSEIKAARQRNSGAEEEMKRVQ